MFKEGETTVENGVTYHLVELLDYAIETDKEGKMMFRETWKAKCYDERIKQWMVGDLTIRPYICEIGNKTIMRIKV